MTQWTGKKSSQKRPSLFRANYTDTLKLLKFELEKASCRGDAQLQMFIPSSNLRADGNLRATAKPYEQGVKLVFQRAGDVFFSKAPVNGNSGSKRFLSVRHVRRLAG